MEKNGEKRGAMKKVWLSVVVLFCAILTLAFAPAFAKTAPKTIKIGTITDQTGPLSAWGVDAKYGYNKAAETFNKEGGIFVKEFNKKIPVEVLWGDHAANEQKAGTEAEYLIQKGVVVLAGTNAVSPFGVTVAEKNKIPILLTAQAQSEPFQQGFRYPFVMFFQDDDFAKWPFWLIESFPDPKPTKIGIMEEQEIFGVNCSIYFQREAIKRKFSNYVIEKYQRFAADFSNSVLALKKAGVDFVYAPMIGPDGIPFMKQMKQFDFSPKAILMLSAPSMRKDWLSLGQDGNYVFTSNAYHWALPYPGVKEFAATYRADNNGENPPEVPGATYAAMQVIKDAIERAGTLDPKEIRDAMATTNFVTILGPTKFGPNGKSLLKPFVVQYIDGVETIVWPKDLAERGPVYPFPPWKSR